MVTATEKPRPAGDSKITLSDVGEAIFNGEAKNKTDLDVLEAIARDKQGLTGMVAKDVKLIEKAGGKDELLRELNSLNTRYDEQIKTIGAGKDFEQKVEKQSWGKWALEKVKSVVLFPVRHPVYTLLILAAVAAGIGLYYSQIGTWLLNTIPNYSGKAAEVIRQGMKYASDKMADLGAVVNSGQVPGPTMPGGPVPYESPPTGIFASPNGFPVPDAPPLVAPPPVSLPPVPPASGLPPINIPPPGSLPPGTGFGQAPY